MSKKSSWSPEATSALINAFEAQNCLHYHRRIVNPDDVNDAITTILRELNTLGYNFTLVDIRHKMTSLQVYYHQLRRKPRHEIVWTYFDRLAFLEKKYNRNVESDNTSPERTPPSFVYANKADVCDLNNNNAGKSGETQQLSQEMDVPIKPVNLSSEQQEKAFIDNASMVSRRQDHSQLQSSDQLIQVRDSYGAMGEKDEENCTNHESETVSALHSLDDTNSSKKLNLPMEFIDIDGEKTVIVPSTTDVAASPSVTSEQKGFSAPYSKIDESPNENTNTDRETDMIRTRETASFPQSTNREDYVVVNPDNRGDRLTFDQRFNGNEDDHYGLSISQMMKEIPECDEKKRLKYEIHENIQRVRHFISNNRRPFHHHHHHPNHHGTISNYHVASPSPLIDRAPYHVTSPEPVIGQTPQHFYYSQPSESCIILNRTPNQHHHRHSPYERPAKR